MSVGDHSGGGWVRRSAGTATGRPGSVREAADQVARETLSGEVVRSVEHPRLRLRFRYREAGAHVHVRVFVNGALSGTLAFTVTEYEDFVLSFGAVPLTTRVEFLAED